MHIREANLNDAAAIGRVRVDSWRSTYQGILPEDYLEKLSYEEHTRNWQSILASNGRQGFAYVVENDALVENDAVVENEAGEVIGFALGGPERSSDPVFTGEIYAIYLLPGFQRQGLGRQLARAIILRLIEEGMYSILVWVLAENPSRRFYEALGGRPVYEKEVEISGMQFMEVAYGWRDIRSQISAE